jgi:hypothetical protein
MPMIRTMVVDMLDEFGHTAAAEAAFFRDQSQRNPNSLTRARHQPLPREERSVRLEIAR